MSIANNLQRAHEWAEVRRDPAVSEGERQQAQLNEALFERDYLAEVLRFVNPGAYRTATELLYPGSTKRMAEILATIERNASEGTIAR